MDERMERWLVTTFDDAVAQVALPPRAAWLPKRAERRGHGWLMTFAAVAVIFVTGAVLGGLAGRDAFRAAAPAKPSSPTATLVPGGSESETWGKVWSVSMGATVLRPTWLPPLDAATSYDVATSSNGLSRYIVAYSARSPVPPGPRPAVVVFIAEGPDIRAPVLARGESSENILIRGQEGRFITATDGTPRIIWTENGIRYTVQLGTGVPPETIFRIVSSLAPVVDAQGNTR
jgi:hypothetical protein